ncbi:MAG: pitrilysin family protein [Polyangiaceae bacterium]
MSARSRVERTEVGGVPLFVETSHALPLVNVIVARKTGAVLDPLGHEGITRLLSRLSRRTAGGRPLQTIEETLDRLGASLGTDAGYSSTSLSGTVISRSLEPFIELVADAMGRPSLDVTEFERLKRETRAEIIEGLDNDRALAHRALRRTMYPNHPYARSASGTIASIARIEHEAVRAYDAQVRRRDSLVIGMSGSIDLAEARRHVERILEAIPTGLAPHIEISDPIVPEGRRLVIVDKPERAQTQILIGLSGTKPTDPDQTALHVAITVFGGTFSSRLMQEIRVARGWSYGAYASLPIDRHRQMLSLWTFPSKEDAASCGKLQIELLEKLVADGITEDELDFAKKSLVRSHAFSIDTAAKRLGLAIDIAVLGLPEDYYDQYEERVAAVTLDEANAALRTRLDPSRLVFSVVGSADELKPRLLDAIPSISSVDVIPFDSEEL